MDGHNRDSAQKRAPGPWAFYNDMRRMNETTNETTPPCKPVLMYCLVRGGGGCEIRTREGLHPTRFPTMLTAVHRRPRPSATCADAPRVAVGERFRTGVNETTFETRPTSRAWRGRLPGDGAR